MRLQSVLLFLTCSMFLRQALGLIVLSHGLGLPGPAELEQIAQRLSDHAATREFVTEWRADWAAEFSRVVRAARLAHELHVRPLVFVPAAGGDIFSALAVQPRARGIVLADQNPLTPRGADAAQLASAWSNGSFVARARGAAARLLQTSHGGGFQYGGALAAFAGEFGMASFALAACGALADGLSLGAAALFEAGAVRGLLVELTRRRSGRALWLRFVELDLHDAQALGELGAAMIAWGARAPHVTSVLKGTEQALRYQPELRAAQLPALAPARARELAAARARHNASVDRLAHFVLNVSGVVIQDVGGIPLAHLRAWVGDGNAAAGAIEAFGAFACASATCDTNRLALDSLYANELTNATVHGLGRLRFGYCELVENADDRRAFARHGPTASELESLAGDRNDPHEAHRVFCCHMLVAFRRMRPLLERGSGPRHR